MPSAVPSVAGAASVCSADGGAFLGKDFATAPSDADTGRLFAEAPKTMDPLLAALGCAHNAVSETPCAFDLAMYGADACISASVRAGASTASSTGVAGIGCLITYASLPSSNGASLQQHI